MNETVALVISIALGAVAMIILVLLFKYGKISAGGISAIGDIVESIVTYMPKDSWFKLLGEYVQKAVLAVEQLVNTGQLAKDDVLRKTQAISIVGQYAAVDGIELSNGDYDALDSLIEAEVALLPHSTDK